MRAVRNFPIPTAASGLLSSEGPILLTRQNTESYELSVLIVVSATTEELLETKSNGPGPEN
jgi:hypothetical protein